jgi:hypothetical protein
MALLSWWPAWAEGMLLFAGTAVAWALGLYVVTRGGLRRVPLLAALAVFAISIYLTGQALGALAPEPERWLAWLHRTWWGAALAPAFWLALTVALAIDEGPAGLAGRLSRRFVPVTVIALAVAVLLGALSVSGEALLRWSSGGPQAGAAGASAGRESWHVPRGWLYPAYQAYILSCAGAAALILTRLRRLCAPGTPLHARFTWLLASAVLFVLASLYLTIASSTYAYPSLPGELLLIAGILIMAWNIARYGALLAGEVVTADAVAFALSLLSVLVIYGALLVLVAPLDFAWIERGLPLLLVVVSTHALIDARGHVLDRLVYGRAVSALTGQLRSLVRRVVRQPDVVSALAEVRETLDTVLRVQEEEIQRAPQDGAGRQVRSLGALRADTEAPARTQPWEGLAPAELRVLVEGALRRLNDLPGLSQHPLKNHLLTPASPVTDLEHAALLRRELEQAIERLRPPGPRPMPGSSAGTSGWLHYLVLHEAYVEGRPNKQIMQRYHLSEGTFHRARRRAIDALALDLYQRNVRDQRSMA